MTIIIAFVLGLLAGVIPKGIHIHIHKPEQKKQEKEGYNESMAKHLPPEVQNYYQSTGGANKF
jgi:hypothetical protein